ncbi:hypothetical protein HQN90_04780 [Paenibacillus alba]|nr:hypothetical protein [Paenibacillus alba]NQX65438.1 hypothetical protein [Paenibacillus alba]
MAEHIPALPEQMIERAHMIIKPEYEKTCTSRVMVNMPGQVFVAIKKA